MLTPNPLADLRPGTAVRLWVYGSWHLGFLDYVGDNALTVRLAIGLTTVAIDDKLKLEVV